MILEMIQGIFAGVTAIALLMFSGITLCCSALVFLISTPLFIIFSPVLVPATIATTLLASGFTASGSFLSTAISIITMIIKKRREKDMPQIPGIHPSIIAEIKKEEKKEKKKKKDKKEKEDGKNMKETKNNMKDKKEKQKMKKEQKKDNMRDKNKDKMKEERK